MFFYVFPKKVRGKGVLGQALDCFSIELFFFGKMNSSDYLGSGPKWSLLNRRLDHPLLAHGPGLFRSWGFSGLSLLVKALREN